MPNKSFKGFTLIELLIVVAVIAILAAIALPNFLEAQTRSKVSRAKADLRTLATAMEAYCVDNNSYCPDSEGVLDAGQGNQIPYEDYAKGQIFLTTPVAYISNTILDPFDSTANSVGTTIVKASIRIGSGQWAYRTGISPKDLQDSTNTMAQYGQVPCYVLLSVGPDEKRCRNSYKSFPWRPINDTDQKPTQEQPNYYVDYDPTNGSTSIGDVYRFGGDYLQGNWQRNGNGPEDGPRGSAAN